MRISDRILRSNPASSMHTRHMVSVSPGSMTSYSTRPHIPCIRMFTIRGHVPHGYQISLSARPAGRLAIASSARSVSNHDNDLCAGF